MAAMVVDRGRTARGLGIPLAILLVSLLAAPAFAVASSYVHAHRGGPLATVKGEQKPVLPEETLATFRKAAQAGYVVELDVKLTADNIPVVIHDASLDRTTTCEGNVIDFTLAELRSQCVVDLLGTDENSRPMKAGDPRRRPVPKLGQVLKMAKANKATINLEIKNIPGDPDFEASTMPAYAKRIATRIQRSEFPPKKLILQSFYPPNLDVFESIPYFEPARISYLSLNATNDVFLEAAISADADIISPGWPIDAAFVERAHAAGLDVAPYTLDDVESLEDARDLGVDAVITNDPALATELAP
jgi:glycerophosphoryl diester phosphodiesterase